MHLNNFHKFEITLAFILTVSGIRNTQNWNPFRTNGISARAMYNSHDGPLHIEGSQVIVPKNIVYIDFV